MTPQISKFTVEGVEYIVTPHDGVEGLPIILYIAALGADPLLHLIKTLVKVKSGGLSAPTQEELLSLITAEELGTSLQTSLYRIAENPEMVQRLFARTIREGVELANPTAFRQAYQGRWKEFVLALVEIVKVNGFIPF